MRSFASFDKSELEWFARRADPSLVMGWRWNRPDWQQCRDAISSLFDLHREAHFLKQPPGLFPRLWERQITKALQALLLATPSRTLERSQALLRSLGGAATSQLAHVDRVEADDEARMDLAVHARTVTGEKLCIVIEAKLESELSDRQLLTYLRKVRSDYPAEEQRHMWVVAPTKTAKTAKMLDRHENSEWRFVSWRRLLLNWQRQLPSDPGPDALGLFAEIWSRIGGR